jgi:hypothetical protein
MRIIITSLLVLILAFGCFTGCKKAPKEEAPATETVTEPAPAPVDTTAAPVDTAAAPAPAPAH